ncbi:hypothetical protein [Noviherbaspirillum pedocola]|uniref:Uncharacterized protein n=1 Tax=Noviherbaspirillum pedocola TaxID=2801341 RepID=A0A934SUG1_9BURK|nr:hypothetical protein [Noviherbaspirillum pedocola]MBK4735922.1 hypothetical protein [Noviherbaspirillum pedocola]
MVKTAKLSFAVSTVTPEGVQVCVGQVWRDLDERMGNRQCRVEAVDEINGKATMRSVHSPTKPATKVAIRRMRRGSAGWELVREASR